MSWMAGSAVIFSNFYGPSESGKILGKTPHYMANSEKFMSGIKEGSEDAKTWKKKGSPMGLALYIQENID